jgi:hypothetical protein
MDKIQTMPAEERHSSSADLSQAVGLASHRVPAHIERAV